MSVLFKRLYIAMKGFNIIIYPWRRRDNAVLQVENMVKFRQNSTIQMKKYFQGNDAKKSDCNNCFIAPGLIDLQIYGGGGYLFSNKPSAPALKSMADSLLANGTTSFFLTLATNSMEIFREAIKVVKENPHPALMGLHFEGPYIN